MERVAVGGFENHASSCQSRNTHAYARAFAPSKVVSQILFYGPDGIIANRKFQAEQHATLHAVRFAFIRFFLFGQFMLDSDDQIC
jgi:hypothetical protein